MWEKSKKRWVGAGDLTPSAKVATSGGGSAMVIAVVNFAAARDMYDLTVSAVHTFYVLAAGTPVLVHNCGNASTGYVGGCECAAGGTAPRAIESGYVEPTELHHVLPQAFRARFASLGLNIDAHTVKLPSSVHQAAHDVGWNDVWKQFVAANPSATRDEVVGQASSMMWEFGLDKYSQGVFPYR